MTGWRKRQVMEMARKAGMVYREFEDEFANANTDGVDLKTIEAFAELVRADDEGRAAGRVEAFIEIADKIKAMPFGGDTIDSLIIWLEEQK